jgi:hypothetical protein
VSELEAARAANPAVEHIVHLQLTHAARVDLDRVPEALGSPTAPWLGEPAPDTAPGVRRFLCDLELHAGGSERAVFRKSALVTLGEPVRDGAAWVVPIEWRAATLAPLFPVFVGRLRVARGVVELDGSYAPPGGRLGYVLDAALLGVGARGTGHWFLRRIASVLA